ncbi:LysR family transcriptional regulator [Enterovibrio paralichthyis]|uniref:LysR family transcriptional regulator n=1 Tax=Enterovibrio paralichthyis TaxID=2853805 RepID=UPI001C44E06D|nr:LysR family transcriptional regulator [Enterovibrio paralichthyis]MBV7298241.1 LysR family transcriptional regulator [Enterovibrio paralichthyis]
MLPTMKQIRYFIATADAGQVSLAANVLHVSQSAITTAIKQLEEMLNVNLFVRQPHGMLLTYEGNQFYQHATHIVKELEEAMLLSHRRANQVAGAITIAMSYTLAGYFVPPYLTRFQRSYPNVKVKMVEATRSDIEEGIVSGDFDVAFMLTSNLINQEDISFQTLLSSQRRLWLSSSHPLLENKMVTFHDVAQYPYIMLTVDEASNTAQRYWNQTPYQPDTIFRTSSVESVRSLVANDYGITILSDMVYRPWSLEGRRVEVRPLADHVPAMEVGLVWSRKRERSKAVTAFCEFMELSVMPDTGAAPRF